MRPRTSSQCALSVIEKRPSATSRAGNDRGRVHPAPGADLGNVLEHEIADDRAGQRAQRLEAEGAQHQRARALLLGMLSEMIRWAVG